MAFRPPPHPACYHSSARTDEPLSKTAAHSQLREFMRRFVSILLAATLLAGAFGGLLAVAPGVAASDPVTPPLSTAAYGPHWMLPNPDVYPTVPFTQSASWTGTPPSG